MNPNYYVFLQSYCVRDTQGAIYGTINDDTYDNDDQWSEINSPVLLMAIEANSIEEVYERIQTIYPNIDIKALAIATGNLTFVKNELN